MTAVTCEAYSNGSPSKRTMPEEQLRAEYRKIAERRVRLGLVLAEIGRAHDVQVTDSEVNAAINAEARRYPGQERQVFEAYRNRPELQASLRARDRIRSTTFSS